MTPFPHTGPVDPPFLIGREPDLHALVEHLTAHQPVLMVGHRKHGKSSLLRALPERLGPEVRPLLVDCKQVLSADDLALRIRRALQASPDRRLRRIVAAQGRLGGTISAGPTGVSVAVTPGPRTGAPSDLHGLLAAVVEVSDPDRPVLLLFDEWQDTSTKRRSTDDSFLIAGVVRAAIGSAYDRVRVVFTGSEPSLLKRVFADTRYPLYHEVVVRNVGALPHDEFADYYDAAFRDAGIEPGRTADDVARITDLHPRGTMMLSHHVFVIAVDAGMTVVDAATVDDALAAVLLGYDDLATGWFHSLNATEQVALRMIAGGLPPTHRDGLRRLGGYAASAVSDAVRLLRDDKSVIDDDHAFVDPLLGLWVSINYPVA